MPIARDSAETTSPRASIRRVQVGIALVGVIVSLLLVGVVSGTPVRHAIQVAPAIVALVAVARRASWSSHAALAVFVFWIAIMALIWLWLLGLASIVTGEFTPVEIGLTLAVGVACVAGILATARTGAAGAIRLALSFTGFALLQVGAMWLSLRPAISSA